MDECEGGSRRATLSPCPPPGYGLGYRTVHRASSQPDRTPTVAAILSRISRNFVVERFRFESLDPLATRERLKSWKI